MGALLKQLCQKQYAFGEADDLHTFKKPLFLRNTTAQKLVPVRQARLLVRRRRPCSSDRARNGIARATAKSNKALCKADHPIWISSRATLV